MKKNTKFYSQQSPSGSMKINTLNYIVPKKWKLE